MQFEEPIPGIDRIASIRTALERTGLEALICTRPANVLLVSGYWPVVGTSVAVATSDGRIAILAPKDEEDLAVKGWATEVRTYSPGSLERITCPFEAVRSPLTNLLVDLGLRAGRIGYEADFFYEPSSYAAMYFVGPAVDHLLEAAVPGATLVPAGDALSLLHARLMPAEVERVRYACEIAAVAFEASVQQLRSGVGEAEIAAALQGRLSTIGLARPDVERAGGFAFCMSGPNSALAGGAYARSRARIPQSGEFVLVHCNSYIDGYWTDITRTYYLGDPDERTREMYAAVFEARAAALAEIRPGVSAADVDRAARDVLTNRGFGEQFTHALGHNVGLSVISAEFPPRLHPASDDRLEIGMTFNIEPAIYLEGIGGLRHCDVVTLGEGGVEVLTPFHGAPEHLII